MLASRLLRMLDVRPGLLLVLRMEEDQACIARQPAVRLPSELWVIWDQGLGYAVRSRLVVEGKLDHDNNDPQSWCRTVGFELFPSDISLPRS
jgi:hypothetical protein